MVFSKLEVAIHEAAHCIAAELAGIPVKKVSVEMGEKHWQGGALLDFSVLPGTLSACTAEQRLGLRAMRMVGPFAQFQHCPRKLDWPCTAWLPDFAACVGVHDPCPLTKRNEYDELWQTMRWCFCAAYRNPNLAALAGPFVEIRDAAEYAWDMVTERKHEIERLAEHIIANAGQLDGLQLQEWRTNANRK